MVGELAHALVSSPTDGSVIISTFYPLWLQADGTELTYSSVLLTVRVMHPVLSWQYFCGCSGGKTTITKMCLIDCWVYSSSHQRCLRAEKTLSTWCVDSPRLCVFSLILTFTSDTALRMKVLRAWSWDVITLTGAIERSIRIMAVWVRSTGSSFLTFINVWEKKLTGSAPVNDTWHVIIKLTFSTKWKTSKRTGSIHFLSLFEILK